MAQRARDPVRRRETRIRSPQSEAKRPVRIQVMKAAFGWGSLLPRHPGLPFVEGFSAKVRRHVAKMKGHGIHGRG
jgi:hypothetical protein